MSMQIDLAQLVAAIGDALVVSDTSGAITVWNPAAERLFGFTQAEALGQSMDIFIPEKLRKRHWDGYHETMRSGVTKYGTELLRVPAINKAGASLSIAFTVALLQGPDGQPAAIAAVIRDETGRFAEDRALRKRVAELEAQVLVGLARPV